MHMVRESGHGGLPFLLPGWSRRLICKIDQIINQSTLGNSSFLAHCDLRNSVLMIRGLNILSRARPRSGETEGSEETSPATLLAWNDVRGCASSYQR